MDNLNNMVEALLFASGKPMSVEQLSEIIDESSRKIKPALKKIKNKYSENNGALMLVEDDGFWKLTVREAYLPLVRKIVADTELPKSVIETLAVIAWRSPITQARVIKIRTNKAYDHIAELERLGFVIKEKEGRSYRLKLTEKFFEYFDISGNKDIRDMFKNVKGIEEELASEQEKKLNEKNKQLVLIPEDSEEHLGKLDIYTPEKPKAEEDVKEINQIVDEIDQEEKRDEAVKEEIDVVKPEGSQKEIKNEIETDDSVEDSFVDEPKSKE
ncbi:MAG: SMC-Scp complex subunit ScpB [Candidatus Woesearchaeota archaeon]